MARRPRLFAPGLLYHVIVRGNQRRKTFYDEADYRAYLARLARYRQRYGYTIHNGRRGQTLITEREKLGDVVD